MAVQKASKLRAVEPGEKALKPQSLSEAVAGGDYLEILRAQRRDIVASLPDERGPAKAALHRQMALISKEIQALESVAAQAHKEAVEGGAVEDEAWDAEAL